MPKPRKIDKGGDSWVMWIAVTWIVSGVIFVLGSIGMVGWVIYATMH